MLYIRSRIFCSAMLTPLIFSKTSQSYPVRNKVTLLKASFWGFSELAKNNLAMQYSCNWGVDWIKYTKDLADSSLTAWSAKTNTFRMVSKCHLLLCECFSTIRQILRANSVINSSSLAVSKTFNRSLMIVPVFYGEAITCRRSKAIILIRISFSLRHSKIVALWVLTIFMSYLVMRFRLKRDKYLEFASFTEMNLERTLPTIYLSWVVGSSSIKHWKHSNKTALAPFFRLLVTLEHTESWQIIRISASCLSKLLECFLSILRNFKMATCKKGSWTPPISYSELCYWAMSL